ncbi:MAG: lipopolysaccharide biosynthesis protein [Myxococcota bacterium]
MSDSPPSTPISAEDSRSSAALRAEEVASAGSGFLLITGAKLWFLVSATVLNLGLPRFLGDTAQFGDFGTINSLISILNMVLVTGALQAVSKRVSERPEFAHAVRRKAIRIQTLLGGGLFVVLIVGADVICDDLLRDKTLAPYLRIAAVVTLSYAFYASFIGVLNGLRAFASQALFDIAFATLKVVLIVGLVMSGFGVMGAFAGFAGAAVCVTVGAWWVTRGKVGAPAPGGSTPEIHLLGFMVQVMGFVFAINVLIQGDVVVLKRAAFEAIQGVLSDGISVPWIEQALRGADTAGDPTRSLTAALVGLYRAAKNVSLLPYQGVIALTFVIFPLLSRATFETDQESTRLYVRHALRLAWVIVVAIATVLAAGGEGLAVVLFGEGYQLAGGSLLPMVIGMSCLAMMYLVGTVLIAASRPLDALLVTLCVAFVEMAVLYVVVSGVSGSELASRTSYVSAILMRAAWTTAIAGLIGLLLAAWRLRVRVKVPLPMRSILRGSVAAVVALLVVQGLPQLGLWWVFVRALVAGVTFVVVLVLTREITREDWAVIRGTVSRRKVS